MNRSKIYFFTAAAFIFTTLVLAFSLGALIPATAQTAGVFNNVSMSGKQRMLSQRVLKAYAQLLLNVAPEKASSILAASMEELKSGNATLSALKGPNQVALGAQTALINKLAGVVATPPSASSLRQALQLSEELLENAEAVTQAFTKSSSEAPAALVNLAARQRMLSQRAASAYFVFQTLPSPELKQRALKAIADFKAAITAFEDAKTEFPQISDRIELARVQMLFFENAMSTMEKPEKAQLMSIATTSERILGEMDSMTAEISKQLAARSAAPVVAPTKKN